MKNTNQRLIFIKISHQAAEEKCTADAVMRYKDGKAVFDDIYALRDDIPNLRLK